MTFDPKVTAHFHARAAPYKIWSPEGHLHFGYWRWPMNPFRLQPMLEELIDQVVGELRLTPNAHEFAARSSGFHGLALLVWTILHQLARRRSLTTLEKAHLRSCALGILMGTQFDLFRYCLVTATR